MAASTRPNVLADARAIATASAKAAGITIHPGAVIGHRLFIDPGSDVLVQMGNSTGGRDWPVVLRDVTDQVERLPREG